MTKEKSVIDNIKSYIVIAVFVAGLFGSWYDSRTEIALLKKQVDDHAQLLKENNLEVINFKIDQILTILNDK